MPAPTTTLLIEGSFTELADEFAQYIDALRKTESGSTLHAEISPLLQPLIIQEQNGAKPDFNQREEVLKKLVVAASILNSAPEKGELMLFAGGAQITNGRRSEKKKKKKKKKGKDE